MADVQIPNDLKYLKSDEWIRVEGDTATIGISDFAQNALNDIVYVELPGVGDSFKQGEAFGSIESVKAASDLLLPAGGEVTAVNGALEDTPELVNSDPYGAGWMIKIKLTSPTDLNADDLLDAAAYEAYCATR